MKKFKIGLCFLDEEDNVVVKKLLNSHWSVDLEKHSEKFRQPLIRDEIASVLLEGIQMGLSTEIIKEMLEELEDK